MFRMSLTLTALLALLALCERQTAEAATRLDAETMKAALQTATPEENGFIQHVLDLVDLGKLPESLVESTFLWARKKPRRKFQYFKFGLTVRARRVGIELWEPTVKVQEKSTSGIRNVLSLLLPFLF
jgi:hypothetical protein